jgi:hypothetical protein
MVAQRALQCFVALLVALDNRIPLGTLNHVKGVRVVFPARKPLVIPLIDFTLVAIGLAATAFGIERRHLRLGFSNPRK